MRPTPPQRPARVAGASYLLVIVIGVFNGFLIDSPLLVAGSDAATVQNLLAHPTLFRLGAAATLVLYALVVVLAWALYEVLRAVDASIARLGLLFRVAEAVVGVATILMTIFVADLLGNADRMAAFGEPRLHAMVGAVLEARTTGMDLVLVLIGVGGSIFCWLLFRSRFVPAWLAAWGVVTYLSMLTLGLVSLIWRDHPQVLEAAFYGPGALFELTVGGWLLLKGIDEGRWNAITSGSSESGGAKLAP